MEENAFHGESSSEVYIPSLGKSVPLVKRKPKEKVQKLTKKEYRKKAEKVDRNLKRSENTPPDDPEQTTCPPPSGETPQEPQTTSSPPDDRIARLEEQVSTIANCVAQLAAAKPAAEPKEEPAPAAPSTPPEPTIKAPEKDPPRYENEEGVVDDVEQRVQSLQESLSRRKLFKDFRRLWSTTVGTRCGILDWDSGKRESVERRFNQVAMHPKFLRNVIQFVRGFRNGQVVGNEVLAKFVILVAGCCSIYAEISDD